MADLESQALSPAPGGTEATFGAASMTRHPLPLLLLGAAVLGPAPLPAAAQSGSALDMIERLRPRGGTRGIRMPGAEPRRRP